jgi:hypothetical protein
MRLWGYRYTEEKKSGKREEERESGEGKRGPEEEAAERYPPPLLAAGAAAAAAAVIAVGKVGINLRVRVFYVPPCSTTIDYQNTHSARALLLATLPPSLPSLPLSLVPPPSLPSLPPSLPSLPPFLPSPSPSPSPLTSPHAPPSPAYLEGLPAPLQVDPQAIALLFQNRDLRGMRGGRGWSVGDRAPPSG